MKTINVLSWGGGTQSTAMMLMLLKEKYPIDYIIFSDTGDESEMTYAQVYKVQKYVKDTYNQDIIITKRNQDTKSDQEIIKLIKSGEINGNKYRSSKYADLYQNQVLFYQGHLDKTDIIPHWVVNKYGEIGKLMGRQCTIVYKINVILKELRLRENIKRFDKNKHKINMMIGFTTDEIARVKPSPTSYIENIFPLVDRNLTKLDCIDYVIKELGFKPHSSVCNMCYANNFNTIYDIYINDKKSWDKILKLDEAMANKPLTHRIKNDVYMFHWQAKIQKRFSEIDMDVMYKERNKYHQFNIFDDEMQNACMGGCFL